MPRVLLVDDEEGVRFSLGELLKTRGYDVDSAADGEEALEKARAEPPDIVVTDIVMPKTGGLEVLTELRTLCPGVPVIAISGGGRISAANYLEVASLFGAAEVLEKPFEFDTLLAAVEKALA